MYILGRQCGEDVVLNCSNAGESVSLTTPTTGGDEDPSLCVWTYRTLGHCLPNVTVTHVDMGSLDAMFQIFSGSINHTREYEYYWMIEYTNFIAW